MTDLLNEVCKLMMDADGVMGSDFDRPGLLMMLQQDEEGVVVGIRMLQPGEHPLDVLPGLVAGQGTLGLGVVCHGWATRQVDGMRPSQCADRQRVRSFSFVMGDGREVSGFRIKGEDVSWHQGACIGQVADALREVMLVRN